MTGRARSGAGIGWFVLGLLSVPLLLAAGATMYLEVGRLPVAVADRRFPFENLLLRRPTKRRIDQELSGQPFGSGPEVFQAGARIYKMQCASCHGTPDHDSNFATYMYPRSPQLWKRGGKYNAIGVSDTQTGRTYWKIANGVRLAGMPSYSKILTETEMWQVTLLLKHAGQPLPDKVMAILEQ